MKVPLGDFVYSGGSVLTSWWIFVNERTKEKCWGNVILDKCHKVPLQSDGWSSGFDHIENRFIEIKPHWWTDYYFKEEALNCFKLSSS